MKRPLALGTCRLFVFGLSLWPIATRAEPPIALRVTPPHGETDVDPALGELRVEFDQDMSTGGYSLCGGGPNFPKFGKPRWLDKRTLVASMELEPGHAYALSLNCRSASNFRGVGGEALWPHEVNFRTRALDQPAPAKRSADDNRQALEKLRDAIENRYSYRDLHGVDWKKRFAEHEASILAAESPAALAQAIANVLRAARDLHISLTFGNTRIGTFQRSVAANVNLGYLKKRVPGWKERSNNVYSGRFDDGTAYILIASWSDADSTLKPALEALGELADAKALVIDVRPNSGGNESLAAQFAGSFVAEPAVYSRHLVRAPSAEGGWSDPIDRVVRPTESGPKFRGKAAALMGPANMSSCESFLLMMKQAAGCLLVGDRSYGSSGNPKPHDLGGGVRVFLPSWRDLLPDGAMLEGRGIDPDVKVPAAAEAFKDGDPVLDAALEKLRKQTTGS